MSQIYFKSIWYRCNRPEFPPSQFFLRGKNGPAHSFPGEKVGQPILSPPSQFPPPPPPNNFKNHNRIIISLHKFKKPLLNWRKVSKILILIAVWLGFLGVQTIHFYYQSFGLLYSFTVSKYFRMTCQKILRL